MVGLALIFTEENFLKASYLVVMAHIPVMIIEGIITAFCVGFLRKVRPENAAGATTRRRGISDSFLFMEKNMKPTDYINCFNRPMIPGFVCLALLCILWPGFSCGPQGHGICLGGR